MSEAIIVACIMSVGGVLAAIMQSLKKENKTDHNFVADGLARIESKIDNHVRDHAKDVF